MSDSVPAPPGSSDFERAQLVALELIRRAVADLPMAIALNAAKAQQAGGGVAAAPTPDAIGEAVAEALEDKYGSPRDLTSGDRPGTKPREGDLGKGDIKESGTFQGQLGKIGRWLERMDSVLEKAGKNPVQAAGQLAQGASNLFGTVQRGLIGAGVNAFSTVANMLQMKFAAILGPSAVFGQVLSSNTAGLSVLSKAVSVVGAAIGSMLLPFVISLSVALIEFADKFHAHLMPMFEEMAEVVFTYVIPALRRFGEAVMDVIKFITKPLRDRDEKMEKAKDELRPMVRDMVDKGMPKEKVMGMIEGGDFKTAEAKRIALKMISDLFDEESFAAKMGRARGEKGVVEKRAGGGLAGGGAMADVLKELRMSFGPRASIGSLANVGNAATLAALNQSPFEAKILKMFTDTMKLVERGAVAAEKAIAPKPVFPVGGA